MTSPGAISTQADATVRTDPVLVTVRLVSGAEVTGYVHVTSTDCMIVRREQIEVVGLGTR